MIRQIPEHLDVHLDRDGRLIVTVRETVEATAEDLAPALQAA